MRKRSRKQPFCIIDTTHQASSAVACDSSSSSLCCFPFFCLLFITWIVLFTLNPTLSHYPGSYSWSVPWLGGVHADQNNGVKKVQDNVFLSETRENPVPSSEGKLSNHIHLVTKNKSSGLRLVPDRKCRAPSYNEVFSLSSFPACRHCSRGFRTGTPQGSARRRVSQHANEGRNESQQFQDISDEGPLHREGKVNGRRDGVVDDSKISIHGSVEEQVTHAYVKDDKQHQTEQQIEYSTEDCVHDSEHYSVANVENDKQDEEHTLPPREDPPTYDEARSALATPDILNKIHLRQEPGDGLYNYAADSKGAKILASNKEAKGASNILNKDRDKYFRTPCNVETKFVDMELSEETLVVQMVIANHEFYSSNVREFEVWGSLTYPTEEWLSVGKFEAENSRVSQLFALRKPQWVRYLKLQMLSHFGSDFYCTLSTVEVYGVDAIELFLEEWIAEEAGAPSAQTLPSKEENSSVSGKGGSSIHAQSHAPEKDADSENDIDLMLTQNLENTATDKVVDFSEVKTKNTEKPQSSHHQTARPALDAVMKLLMQKVRSLEHKEPVFFQQFKDLDEKYNEASRAHSKDQLAMTSKLEDATTEIANLSALLRSMESKWRQERHSMQRDIFNQVKAWNTDLIFLRNELTRMENKELVALAVSFFSIIAVAAIQVSMLCVSVFKPGKQTESLLLACSRRLWAVPFLSCVLVVFVLSL